MIIAKIIILETTGVLVFRKRIPAGVVGAQVELEFQNDIWSGLNKTVVFRGIESRIGTLNGNLAAVPYETVRQAGHRLYFGIFGYNNDGFQLPLIEVCLGTVEESADPNADPGADPELPIWAQLQKQIDELKKSGASDEQIAQAVEDYFAEHPIEAPDSDEGVDFKTDETLSLKNGVLSVNTTNDMEQDNTLPITSAGVYATVGNIEALLKTI